MAVYIPETEIISIQGFLKIGRREHLEALRAQGQVYMNTLSYFRSYYETDKEHGDKYEGIAELHAATSGRSIRISIPNPDGTTFFETDIIRTYP